MENKISVWAMPGIKTFDTSSSIIAMIEGVVGFSIIEKTRKREIKDPRQIAMYVMKQRTKLSLAQIGQNCGNKDHATVLHACRTVTSMLETNKEYVEKYRTIFEFYGLI